MFERLFGRKKDNNDGPDPAEVAADEAFDNAKQAALERVLGPMDDMVLHAIIPFFMGGGLDLYTFSKCIPGAVFATQELITRDKKNRTKKGKAGHFELVACLPPTSKGQQDEEGVSLINSILNPVAMYASMAAISPGETAEIPGEDDESTQPLLFDSFNPNGVPFEFNNEQFSLLLCMPITQAELAFARREGSAPLLARLRAAGAYPYADIKRQSVV